MTDKLPPIPRHVLDLATQGAGEPKPLSDWRGARAYVLLGEPGGGKSTAFEAEAATHGTVLRKATGLTDTSPDPAWPKDTPLFIDALDERLAGRDSGSRGDAFGAILSHLDGMGWPRFRIACREDFWRGSSDAERLCKASGGPVAVLRLVPFVEAQSRALLQRWPELVPDVERFWIRARDHGLQAMLDNPMLLERFLVG